ncbi:transcription antitermination factor NusB [Deferribacterales bacterium RsTz2092]|nr:N utilization substance protein B [Deferribacterales bacterium]
MSKRTRARECAIQMMYQANILDADTAGVAGLLWRSMERPSDDVAVFAERLFAGAYARKDEHDSMIKSFLKDTWTFDRLDELDICVLRLALEELFYSDTPSYAVIDEYVTLSSDFIGEKRAAFVNGLLENVNTTFIGDKMGGKDGKKS